MTVIDQALTWVAHLSTLAAAFAIFWGVYEFFKKNKEERERQRTDNVERWRQARAHYEFDRSEASGLSFIEYKEKMHSSAFGKDGDKVKKDELDEEELRLVLLSLIEKNAIETFGDVDNDGPKYRVRRANNASDVFMNNTAALPEILEVVRSQTGQYTDAGIANKLRKFAIGEVQMRAILVQMFQMGLVHQDAEGRWYINTEHGGFQSSGDLKELFQQISAHNDILVRFEEVILRHENEIAAFKKSVSSHAS